MALFEDFVNYGLSPFQLVRLDAMAPRDCRAHPVHKGHKVPLACQGIKDRLVSQER